MPPSRRRGKTEASRHQGHRPRTPAQAQPSGWPQRTRARIRCSSRRRLSYPRHVCFPCDSDPTSASRPGSKPLIDLEHRRRHSKRSNAPACLASPAAPCGARRDADRGCLRRTPGGPVVVFVGIVPASLAQLAACALGRHEPRRKPGKLTGSPEIKLPHPLSAISSFVPVS